MIPIQSCVGFVFSPKYNRPNPNLWLNKISERFTIFSVLTKRATVAHPSLSLSLIHARAKTSIASRKVSA